MEVFEGNASDPETPGARIRKVRQRFGLGRVVLVADRGMLATARINEETRPRGGSCLDKRVEGKSDKVDGRWHIGNPVNPEENFADR